MVKLNEYGNLLEVPKNWQFIKRSKKSCEVLIAARERGHAYQYCVDFRRRGSDYEPVLHWYCTPGVAKKIEAKKDTKKDLTKMTD